MNRKVLLVIVLLVVLAFGMWWYRKSSAVPETQSITQVEDETLRGLGEAIGTVVSLNDYVYYDWVNSDGSIQPLTGRQFGVGTTGSDTLGKYGNISNNDISQVTEAFLSPLRNTSNGYFESIGFLQNSDNTSLVPDEIGTTYVGYEKGEMKCLTKLYIQTDPFGYFFCGTVDTAQEELQKSFLDTFPYEKNADGSIASFRVAGVEGDFASGSASPGGPGGYQWIAKNTDGTWGVVWEGQDFPLCSDMQMYEVPTSMYPGCYDPTIQNVKRSYSDTDPMQMGS